MIIFFNRRDDFCIELKISSLKFSLIVTEKRQPNLDFGNIFGAEGASLLTHRECPLNQTKSKQKKNNKETNKNELPTAPH